MWADVWINAIRVELDRLAKLYPQLSLDEVFDGASSHQMYCTWVFARIVKELDRCKHLRSVYSLSQHLRRSVAVFDCRYGVCSLWYEFDLYPFTMCEGLLLREDLLRGFLEAKHGKEYAEGFVKSLRMCLESFDECIELLKSRGMDASAKLKCIDAASGCPQPLRDYYRRALEVAIRMQLRAVPLRPDIAVLSGAEDCKELVQGFRVVAIIECKDQDFDAWRHEIDAQIAPYREIFQPDVLIVVSPGAVPQSVKLQWRSRGIVIIDNVYPGGVGEAELAKLVKDLSTCWTT